MTGHCSKCGWQICICDEIEQNKADWEEALAIVRELAGSDPWTAENRGCAHCDTAYNERDTYGHDKDCLWLRAQKFKKEKKNDEPTG